MRKALISLAIAFVALGRANADSADLQIQFDPDPVQHAGSMFYGNIFIRNLGPDTARNVVVTQKVNGFPEVQLPCPEGRCVIGDVKTTDYYPTVPRVVQQLPIREFTFTMTVTVSSDTPDPNSGNNSVTLSVQVSMAPFLRTYTRVLTPLDPGLPFVAELSVWNEGQAYATAHDVVVTLDVPDGVGVTSMPDECTVAGSKITCRLAELSTEFGYFGSHVFKLGMTAPRRYEGGTLTFHSSALSKEPGFAGNKAESTSTATMYRTFFVTSTADHGSGSLRAALEEANALCTSWPSCDVRFNIAEAGARPWKTIRLETPLPPIGASSLRIDGAGQTAFSGISNPDGPPIEIAGGGRVDGDGLVANCYVEIAHLAINGFRHNGISLTTSPGGACSCTSCLSYGERADIHDNFIGTDPTGSVAVPNDRGIGFGEQSRLLSITAIANNVISGNAKSGIFALGGDLEATANRIGLKAHTDEPLPNGASGIYLDRATGRINLFKNIIAFNRQMGVAIHRQAPFVYLFGNRIWRNGAQAVDDGLDGPTPSVDTSQGPLSAPILTSAVFNPVTQKTTILGQASPGTSVEFFTSDTRGAPGSGDAQRKAGDRYRYLTAGLPAGSFQVEYDGDLRGQWITATATRGFSHPYADVFSLNRTSELSAAVQVQ